MFQTDTASEYAVAAREFGFTEAELRQLTRNAIEAGFCPAEVKERLLS